MDPIEAKRREHSQNITGDCAKRPNCGVECDSLARCETCGWNYAVEKERKEKNRLRARLKSPVEVDE